MTWGTRVRLAGGHLAHYGGQGQGQGTPLAHGDLAWTGTLRPVAEYAPDCPRCLRRLPELERLDVLLRDAGRYAAPHEHRGADVGWPRARSLG